MPGRLQARYNRLVRRFGGEKNPGAKKKAIVAIAHTLLKIAYSVLKSGKPYQEPGEDFYTLSRNPRNRQAWLEAELRKLHPGRPVTVIIGPGDDRHSPDGCSLPGSGSPPGSKPLTATAASG